GRKPLEISRQSAKTLAHGIEGPLGVGLALGVVLLKSLGALIVHVHQARSRSAENSGPLVSRTGEQVCQIAQCPGLTRHRPIERTSRIAETVEPRTICLIRKAGCIVQRVKPGLAALEPALCRPSAFKRLQALIHGELIARPGLECLRGALIAFRSTNAQ